LAREKRLRSRKKVSQLLARISHQPGHNPDVSPSAPVEAAESRLAG
jgi:hypothetical protein